MAKVEVDINSARHWIATCRGKDPDDPRLTNKMIAKLGAKDIAPLFAPMRFVGWRRYRNGAYIVSALAKDRSNLFVFEVDGGATVPHWGLDEIAKYVGKARRDVTAIDAVVAADEAPPTKQDLAAAKAAFAKLRPGTTEISMIARSEKAALRVVPDTIARFTKLDSLQLHDHAFTTLPDAIGKLSNLTNLEIHGGRLRHLPAAIGQLHKLESLVLDWTQIETLPDAIGSLQALQTLSLESCSGLASLPKSLARCTALTALYLTHVPKRKQLAAQVKKWLPGCTVHALP